MQLKAYVTGADRGLGLAMTNELLDRGYKVYAGSYMPDWHELTEAASRRPSGQLTIVPLDVSDDGSVREAAAAIGADTETLHLLINNAGSAIDRSGTILEPQYYDDIRKLFEINTLGPLRVTQSVLPLLMAGNPKRLVNISSAAASVGGVTRTTQYGYTMSKAALNMQSKLIHNHLHGQGLQVYAIHPGWMHTHIFGDLDRMKEAPFKPSDSARAIVELIHTRMIDGDGIFMDYSGTPMSW